MGDSRCGQFSFIAPIFIHPLYLSPVRLSAGLNFRQKHPKDRPRGAVSSVMVGVCGIARPQDGQRACSQVAGAKGTLAKPFAALGLNGLHVVAPAIVSGGQLKLHEKVTSPQFPN